MQKGKEGGADKMQKALKITLATGNKHKTDEVNLICRDYNIEFILPEGEFKPMENGKSFLENAYCKAKYASKNGKTRLYLADDSGLCVDALKGEPGIYSARYAQTQEKRIEKLLFNMKNTDKIKDRKAEFVCAMVVVDKNANILFKTEQKCKGYIIKEKRGSNGFGYDPVFFIDEKQKTMAQLSKEEKNKISHRAKSLNMVLNWLKNEYRKYGEYEY